QARLQYAVDRGIRTADVSGSVGAGALRLGGFEQPLEGVELVTRYDAASKQVLLQRFDLRAQRTRLDVTGRLWLVPERRGDPARVEYRFASPHSLISLARTSEPQPLEALTLAGSITPEKRRLDVTDLRVRMAGAPVRMSLAVYGGADTRLSRGVKADIAVTGPMSIQTLYALWPEQLAPAPRRFVTERLHSATVLGSTVHVDIPPGQLDRRRLENRMLRVAFRYAGGGVKVAPTLPGIEDAVGEGVVQGNRFDLTMATGKLGKLFISDATVTVPRFMPGGARAVVRSRAQGDLGDMLRLVDAPPLGMMSTTSMSPDRFSGPADLVIDMSLPLRKGVTRADARVNFAGQLHDLRIKDVTLGEDLHKGEMTTKGTLERVDASGTARVGPYGGKIDFWMPLKGADAGRKHIELDGKVGMLPGTGAPFRTSINTRYGIGRAVVRSRLFEGEAQWRKGERMRAEGIGHPEAWKQAGIPAGPGLPERVPVRLAMTADGPMWTGQLTADAYSGALSYTKGNPRVIRYTAQFTPEEAERIGVGELPMFERAQPVALTARVGDDAGSADYALGGLEGRFEWFPGGGPGRLGFRYASTLDGDDLKGLGLPLGLEKPIQLTLDGTGEAGGIKGIGELAGASLRYDISPEREGRREIAFSGSASDAVFARFGFDVTRMMEGPMDFSGRLIRAGNGHVNGHLGGNFDQTLLTVPNSGWSKPAGKPARGAIDLTVADGTIALRRISADGDGLRVRGSGSVARDGVLSVDLPTARLEGFFDGSVSARRDKTLTSARVDARYLDFRPILKEAQRLAGGGRRGGGAREPALMRLDAEIDRVRVTDSGYVNDVKLTGGWGELDQRRANLTATSEGGGAIDIRVYPDKGATALSLQVADLGDIARTLAGYENLRGGVTSGRGRIVPGGYHFHFEIRDMTMLQVPGAAQILAKDGAISFDRFEAPLQIRGSQVTLGDVVATGPSVGLTARGIMDTGTRTMDVVGVVTPAYGINSALGNLFGAPEGEGLFGVTYRATGPFTNPEIDINPLSVLAPGALRGMFEPRTPTHELEPAAD
ncbi:MAG TPA: AsmA-like C-terminal region-containing protein, partial [Caulobacteraceae bacterium]|nr:AsmA-like C-terminal region-containing protein [Caulobacteraceae bacterium]